MGETEVQEVQPRKKPWIEFRPFRTSAIALAAITAGTLIWVLYILTSVDVAAMNAWATLGIGILLGGVLVSFATAVVKLCDDGGESNEVKIIDRFLDKYPDSKP